MLRDVSVLIAEDDPNEAFLLAYAMKRAGINNLGRIVSDGQHVIDYLQAGGMYAKREDFPLPTLIVLDLTMPRKNGFEVLEWLQRQPHLKLIPVIILTCSENREDVARAYEFGASAYIVKGPDMNQLITVVKKTFDFWSLVTCPPCVRKPLASNAIDPEPELALTTE